MSTPEARPGNRTLWRVFPWDRGAAPGERYSASYVPPPTGRGRFDIPRDLSPVLYLAETPEHAIAETLQRWRGRPLAPYHLRRAGLRLALARVELAAELSNDLMDLCSPGSLSDVGTRPDVIASRHRHRTQPVARAVWEAGHAGLRWWSSFWGDWHTVVLFTSRTPKLDFTATEELNLTDGAVARTAELLGMQVG